jgi:hypothetical protein
MSSKDYNEKVFAPAYSLTDEQLLTIVKERAVIRGEVCVCPPGMMSDPKLWGHHVRCPLSPYFGEAGQPVGPALTVPRAQRPAVQDVILAVILFALVIGTSAFLSIR